MNRSATQRSGHAHEQRALEFLKARGLRLESRNFRRATGEIDLIMRDGDTTVFVEVRYRKTGAFGGALGSIGAGKRRRIAQTALLYLQQRYDDCERPMRFDVVAIDGAHADLHWLRDAFEFGSRSGLG